MAYMDRENFQILGDSNIDGQLDNSFEIDEVIAPAVESLNKKGYLTKFCCSGHPTYSINESFLFPDVPNPEHTIWGTIETQKLADGMTRVVHIVPDDDLYIFFEDKLYVPLADMPEGCFLDKDTIRYRYKVHDYFEMLQERLEICKKLYEWAERLPVCAA